MQTLEIYSACPVRSLRMRLTLAIH